MSKNDEESWIIYSKREKYLENLYSVLVNRIKMPLELAIFCNMAVAFSDTPLNDSDVQFYLNMRGMVLECSKIEELRKGLEDWQEENGEFVKIVDADDSHFLYIVTKQ